jgi:membrane protein implicated in regulation of membrane protease activity
MENDIKSYLWYWKMQAGMFFILLLPIIFFVKALIERRKHKKKP